MQSVELIKEIAAGSTYAFRQFYDLYQAKVYNTALVYLQNTADAEELTQDVFVEVHHSSAKFEGRSSVDTWLYRITINKCLDKIRFAKRSKRFVLITSLFGKESAASAHNVQAFEHPGVRMENKENAAILFAAIKQLPESQQTAFILKHTEHLPQKQIAQIMDLNEKAVESLLHRAKQNLRKTLHKYYLASKRNNPG